MSYGPDRLVGVLVWSTEQKAGMVEGPAPSSGYGWDAEPGSVLCCPHTGGPGLLPWIWAEVPLTVTER